MTLYGGTLVIGLPAPDFPAIVLLVTLWSANESRFAVAYYSAFDPKC